MADETEPHGLALDETDEFDAETNVLLPRRSTRRIRLTELALMVALLAVSLALGGLSYRRFAKAQTKVESLGPCSSVSTSTVGFSCKSGK